MLLWLLFILFEVGRNYYMIEVKKTKPTYIISFIIRGWASILHGIYFDVHNMIEFYPILAFQVSSFWVLFDPLLNHLRNKPLLYQGKTSGWLDKLPPSIYLILKILAVLVSIFILLRW